MTHHRPELEPHLIATRVIGSEWPWTDAIERARHDHEAGKVDMATGRHGDHEYLYAIPRRVREVGRRPWFSRVESPPAEPRLKKTGRRRRAA